MPENHKRGGQRRDPYFNQQPWRRRSFDNRKPPRGGGGRQAGVPPWEKTFCKVVGSLDWHTFLGMKRFVHLFDEVLNWDDSAAEEAFHNAKNRFFSQMQGLPCDISMPDPDLYIDEIDWDSQVDPELVMDLESPQSIPDTSGNDGPVLIFGDVLLQQKGYSPPGWGVIEEGINNTANTGIQWPAVKPTGWGEEFTDDPWEQNLPKSGGPVILSGWGEEIGGDPWKQNLSKSGGPVILSGWGEEIGGDPLKQNLPKGGGPIKPTGWGDETDDDPWNQSLAKSGGPVKATGWGDGFDDDTWEKGLQNSGEAVKATGWGEGFEDGRAVEAAEWPTLQENNWSSSHAKNQANWRGDNYGAWGVKNDKEKQSSYWKNKGARFHGDGIGQNKAACF